MTSSINSNQIIRQGGDLYFTPHTSIAAVTASNLATVKSALDALSVTTVGLISGFNTSMLFDNINSLEAMNCGYGTVLTEADQKANLTVTLLQARNLDFWNNIMRGFRGSVATTPVAVTDEAHGTGWTVGTPFKLNNKDADNTIVASITVKEDGVALILNTDYKTYVGDGTNGEYGFTYITPIAAQTGVITVDYTYAPASSEMFAFNYERVTLPYGIYKFVSCNYTDGAQTKRDIVYLVKHRLDGEAVTKFLNTGENPEGSELSLVGELGGQYFWYTEVVA